MKKYFSKKFSKIQVLNTILSSCNESKNTKDKLIIHTATGIYQGTLRDCHQPDDINIKDGDDILTCFEKLYISSLQDYENSDDIKDDIEVSENPITIELEDVDIITSMKSIHVPFVVIFVDQIIGISIGHFE